MGDIPVRLEKGSRRVGSTGRGRLLRSAEDGEARRIAQGTGDSSRERSRQAG